MARLVSQVLITLLTFSRCSCDGTMGVKSDLIQQIEDKFLEAMAEVLQDGFVEEMVRSNAVSEMRKLKTGHHHMKRELKQVMESLRYLLDNNTCIECLLNGDRNASEGKTCSESITDSRALQRDLAQCNGRRNHLKREIKELKHSLATINRTCHLQSSQTHASTAQTTSPTTVQLATTTAEPENGSRIILAPYHSDVLQNFRQLHINSNNVKIYPYLNLKFVMSFTYSSRLRKLFLCLLNPVRIVSSNLGMHGVEIVKKGKRPLGMAVDEDRELIFMTIETPTSVARMTARGERFTTIVRWPWGRYRYPWAIAVNPKEMKMYVCDLVKVFMVTYDGRYMKTLAVGSNIFGLTLDNTGDFLYYGDDENLMEISLSDNITSVVNPVGSRIFNLVYHNSSVYFSRYSTYYVSSTSLGHVNVSYKNANYKSTDVGYVNVTYKSYPINITNILGLSMCLVI